MTDNSEIRSADRIGSGVESSQTTQAEIPSTVQPDFKGLAERVSLVQAAHIMLLQREHVIDGSAADAMFRAVDVAQGGLGELAAAGVWETVATLEDRVDHGLPGEISGGASLGRSRSETVATALRMQWRVQTASVAAHALELRSALHELANVHAVTVMGAFADRRAAAPTTLAHFLGGVLGPLESSWKRMLGAVDALDRSPLGAGLMVGEVFGADRDGAAKLLGFREPIENTLDASGSIEDIVEALEAIAAQASVIQRFINELLVWIRTDPTSFFIDERWESVPEPAQPAHAVSTRLEQLNYRAQRLVAVTQSAVALLRSQPYGPVSVVWDQVSWTMDDVFTTAGAVITEATAAVREALIVNRAYLANRAGRLYSTAADVAAFLMEDQQLGPAVSQQIAGLAVARLKEASLEASQITPDIIDSAAVLVIGQELKVEMETLGRYIAPRRYIERRDVLGSPKSDRTRAWLANIETGISRDRSEIASRQDRWKEAAATITGRLIEAAESQEN